MALGGSPEYRVILLGEYGVGKTTFLNQVQRITRNASILESSHSDYVECAICVGPPNKQVAVKVLLSDTAGVERYQRTLTNNYFRQADGAILMYDVADLVSFESLQDWIELTQKTLDVGMPEKFVWCLVGNQKDRGSKVDHVRAQSRCEDLRTTLNFLTCALKGEGVMEVLTAITEAMHAKNSKWGAQCTSSVALTGTEKHSNPNCQRC